MIRSRQNIEELPYGAAQSEGVSLLETSGIFNQKQVHLYGPADKLFFFFCKT